MNLSQTMLRYMRSMKLFLSTSSFKSGKVQKNSWRKVWKTIHFHHYFIESTLFKCSKKHKWEVLQKWPYIFSPKNFKSQINLFFIIIFVARLLAPNQTRDARFPDNCIKEFSSNNIVPISRQFEIPLSMAISIDFLGIRQKTS